MSHRSGSVCGVSIQLIDFFVTWGRGEGETLSRHVVWTQCAVGLSNAWYAGTRHNKDSALYPKVLERVRMIFLMWHTIHSGVLCVVNSQLIGAFLWHVFNPFGTAIWNNFIFSEISFIITYLEFHWYAESLKKWKLWEMKIIFWHLQ